MDSNDVHHILAESALIQAGLMDYDDESHSLYEEFMGQVNDDVDVETAMIIRRTIDEQER